LQQKPPPFAFYKAEEQLPRLLKEKKHKKIECSSFKSVMSTRYGADVHNEFANTFLISI